MALDRDIQVARPAQPSPSVGERAVEAPPAGGRAAKRPTLGGRVRPAFTESFRLLAVTIEQMAEARPLRTVLVMSAYAGDGRTVAVANLGLALAEAGKRVAVIDADGRRSTLSDHFTVAAPESIVGGPSGQQITVMHTGEPNLALVTCPTAAGGAADPAIVERVLETLAPRFDYLIIDTPPCLRYADAFRYAPFTDGVLYVVRRRGQDIAAQRSIQARLAQIGAHVLGAVYNDR
jgi:Mrp family chromosome partitioning ATPase